MQKPFGKKVCVHCHHMALPRHDEGRTSRAWSFATALMERVSESEPGGGGGGGETYVIMATFHNYRRCFWRNRPLPSKPAPRPDSPALVEIDNSDDSNEFELMQERNIGVSIQTFLRF